MVLVVLENLLIWLTTLWLRFVVDIKTLLLISLVTSTCFIGILRITDFFIFFDNDFMTVKNLIAYAKKFHKRGVEGQTLLCIDECQFFFDPRDNKRRDRRAWLKFFTQHRKLGFNVILTTPALSLIDRQILGCVEYTVRHRKANNGGIIGHLIPVSLFCAITRWNGVSGSEGIVERRFFKYSKNVSDIYDSYRFFGDAADDASNVSYVNMRVERKEPVDREA